MASVSDIAFFVVSHARMLTIISRIPFWKVFIKFSSCCHFPLSHIYRMCFVCMCSQYLSENFCSWQTFKEVERREKFYECTFLYFTSCLFFFGWDENFSTISEKINFLRLMSKSIFFSFFLLDPHQFFYSLSMAVTDKRKKTFFDINV